MASLGPRPHRQPRRDRLSDREGEDLGPGLRSRRRGAGGRRLTPRRSTAGSPRGGCHAGARPRPGSRPSGSGDRRHVVSLRPSRNPSPRRSGSAARSRADGCDLAAPGRVRGSRPEPRTPARPETQNPEASEVGGGRGQQQPKTVVLVPVAWEVPVARRTPGEPRFVLEASPAHHPNHLVGCLGILAAVVGHVGISKGRFNRLRAPEGPGPLKDVAGQFPAPVRTDTRAEAPDGAGGPDPALCRIRPLGRELSLGPRVGADGGRVFREVRRIL